MRWKLVLLGSAAAGKSSLVLRFVKQQFFEYQESTIGAAFLTQKLDLADRQIIFEIWDTAGQERYNSLIPMYYRGAAASIVVYDITDRGSFKRAKLWIKELQDSNPNIIIALSGNKKDLDEDRTVSYEEAEVFANDNNLIFMETSAKKNINVKQIFEALANSLPKEQPIPQNVIDYEFEKNKGYCCS